MGTAEVKILAKLAFGKAAALNVVTCTGAAFTHAERIFRQPEASHMSEKSACRTSESRLLPDCCRTTRDPETISP
jgi:hypothetical protein